MKKLIAILFGVLYMTISSFAALPNKVFAPYVDVMLWPTFDLMSAYNATGQKYYTLAFITSGGNGQPAWGGITPMDQNFMLDQINKLRAVGGDVIISFGGANGTPIDASITDVNALANAYEAIINQYGLTWIDFDIEGYWVADQASIDRRNQAAKILQTRKPGLIITYCLPVMPYGLTADGVNLINKAKAAGVNIYNVNVMAMDYGQSTSQMGTAAISAAQNTRTQTGLNIGITPMIGKNDTQNETFTLANATEVLNFAKANSFVNMIAMWSVTRDNGGCAGATYASPTCSGIAQSSFAFVNAFKSFSGTTGGGCTSTAIVPYLTVNSGTAQQTSTATLAVGGSVIMSPQPLTGGSWRWTGPASFSSTSREITISNIQTSQAGTYTATYTNAGGCTSSQSYTITVTGGAGGTGNCATIPQYVTSGGNYAAGSVVKNAGSQYQCKPWPYSGWCNGAAWAYAPGTGTYWTDAWVLKGSCTARMAAIVLDENPVSEVKDLSIYPSLGETGKEQEVTFEFEKNAGHVNVQILNTNGTTIQTTTHNNVKTKLNMMMPPLPDGLFLINVKGERKNWTRKYFIK